MQTKLFDPETTYVSVACAAQRLGVTRQRIHQLLRAGRLTSIRSGHIHLVRARDVERRIRKLQSERW